MPDELRLSIEKLIYGGDGLAHADGNTIFVPYVLPGEEVRANAKSRKKKLIWTELVEVTTPAKERGKAKCPHFQKCGGCHYQHIPAAEQLRLKKEILRETLSRLGGVTWDGAIVEHSAEPYGYRNRAQWAVRSGMPRALGYFLPESSVIVPIDECPVLSPRLTQTFAQLQEMARAGRLPEGIQEIEAFADSADEKIALNVAFEKFSKPAAELAAAFQGAGLFDTRSRGIQIPRQPPFFLSGESLPAGRFAEHGDGECARSVGTRSIFRSWFLHFAAGEGLRESGERGCQSGRDARFVHERRNCRRHDRNAQRTRGRFFKENGRKTGVCSSGSAESRIGRGSRGETRGARRQRNCLSFLRSFHAGP